MKIKKYFWVLSILFFICPSTFAQEVEEAVSVPAGISNADHLSLMEQKKKLDETRSLLTKDIDVFNSDCGKVSSSDTTKIEECTRRQELILARVDTYNRDLVRYQESIQRAQSTETKIIGFEKGDINSAPVPVNLDFKGPEPPQVLPREGKSEIKDTPGNIQAQLNQYQEKISAKAKAQAAWNLGFFLTEQGKYDESLQYFKEARSGFEDGSDEARMLDKIISNPRQLPPGPLQGHPIYRNRGDALLDALQYGNRDWDASYTYLQVAQRANPNDAAVRDALNYFEAMYANEKKDNPGASLGQIKPKKTV